MPPLLVFAEFGCTEDGEAEFRRHLVAVMTQRMLSLAARRAAGA